MINQGGTVTIQNSSQGVLPKCRPNEFFYLTLRFAKGREKEEMKSIENDIYLQAPFVG